MPQRLLRLCGPAFSGKSTLARHREALAEAERHLRAGAPLVVVDDTLGYRFLRDDYRKLAAARKGLRPEILEEHLRTFEWPGEDEEPTFLTTEEDAESFGTRETP
jgi:predicted kinase